MSCRYSSSSAPGSCRGRAGRARAVTSASEGARRGHMGMEGIAAVLSPRVNRIRQYCVDVATLVFCAFFAWKSWILLEEAITEGFHSGSSWGPPLWIPYSLMTAGMVLLSLQL